MQVNSRVWRGFYDVPSLCRDIGYNAATGNEILLHYLTDYVLEKTGRTASIFSCGRLMPSTTAVRAVSTAISKMMAIRNFVESIEPSGPNIKRCKRTTWPWSAASPPTTPERRPCRVCVWMGKSGTGVLAIGPRLELGRGSPPDPQTPSPGEPRRPMPVRHRRDQIQDPRQRLRHHPAPRPHRPSGLRLPAHAKNSCPNSANLLVQAG